MVEYLSGGRVQASTKAKVTPTYTEDFSSDSGYTFASGNSISGGVLTCKPAGSLGFVKDLGATLDDDKWTMRIYGWKVQGSGYSWSAAMAFLFGVSDQSTNQAYNGNGDAFGFQVFVRASGGMVNNVVARNDGTYGSGGNSSVGESGTNLSTDTKYYIEFKRTSATAGELRIYSDEDFTTLHTAAYVSDSALGAATGLRYFTLNGQTTGGTHVVTIDKVEFWDDYTGEIVSDETTTLTNVPSGTRLEETSARKLYYGDGAGHFTERGTVASGFAYPAFNSVYESLNPLTTVAKQRFVDWFSGSLDIKRWGTTVSGSGTVTIDDSINGGLVIEASSGTNNNTEINFNGIRQFAPQGSVFICVFNTNLDASTTNHFTNVGLAAGTTFAAGGQILTCNVHTNETYIRFQYGTGSYADTSVAFHQNRTVVKIESTTSNSTISLDGVLQSGATQTGSLPTNKFQPIASSWHGTGGNNPKLNVLYMEAYNT